jgi:hypothetical protein
MKFYHKQIDKIVQLTQLESCQSEVYNSRYKNNKQTLSDGDEN